MNNMELMTNKYGQKIWLEINSHVANAIKKKGVYDESAIHYIEQILKAMHDPVVLDIGASIGNHAIIMAQFSKIVYCFEPMPERFEILLRNQLENHISNMQIFNIGLSDQNETLTFYKDGSTFVDGLQRDSSRTQQIVCRMGDEVLQENDIKEIDFIKVDIEGFEARALYGLRNVIGSSRPFVIMEWNNDFTRKEFRKKYDLFASVFKNYEVRAIAHNHHKYYFGNKWYSQIWRFIYRKMVAKQRMLTDFLEEGNYTNILLYPSEKNWIVKKLKSVSKVKPPL